MFQVSRGADDRPPVIGGHAVSSSTAQPQLPQTHILPQNYSETQDPTMQGGGVVEPASHIQQSGTKFDELYQKVNASGAIFSPISFQLYLAIRVYSESDFFFDLCYCCCRCSISIQIGNNAAGWK